MKEVSPEQNSRVLSKSATKSTLNWARRAMGQIRFGAPVQARTAALAAQLGERAEIAGYHWTAAAFYRQALKLDPAHTAAIAGLGRVQFKRPEQLFIEELKRRFAASVCEVIIEVRNPCNFRCFYCVAAGHNNEPVKEFDLATIDRTLSEIKADLVVISFDCGGGEPTVHPQFPELLRICASHGAVSFPSNNSQNPDRWLPKGLAHRLYVRAAVHPETETKTGLDRYVKHARKLIDAGCAFTSMFIAHPTRLGKIPEYRAYFAEHGVPFMPVAFIGDYKGRRYPYSYTDAEKALIGLVEQGEGSWDQRIQPYTNRIRNFRGIPCLAGYRSLYVARDGGIRRCTYDQRKLPKPLDQPEPCKVKHCGCGLILRDLNVMTEPWFYNTWSKHMELEPVDTSWMEPFAEELGYESASDALLKEHMRMYDELMRAYGKDEFPEK